MQSMPRKTRLKMNCYMWSGMLFKPCTLTEVDVKFGITNC